MPPGLRGYISSIRRAIGASSEPVFNGIDGGMEARGGG